ncbi:MAG: MFS transporter, partial [Methanobacteriaceae archaeon]|nr:MFS transporter [Methanobacteriaceae archaeon]
MSKNDKSMNFYLIIAVSLASFITAYTSNVSVIALPQIANYFNLSIILQNWVVNIFLLTIAVLSIPFGKLCSKWGLKKSFLISEAMFAVGAIGTILSINVAMLFFFRVFQAIASSAIFVTAVAMLVKAIPEEHRGKALGINIGAVYIGLSLSPFLGGS